MSYLYTMYKNSEVSSNFENNFTIEINESDTAIAESEYIFALFW